MIDSTRSFQYEKKFEVLSYQIDPQGQLRWSALGDLLQEIAWKHADSKDFGQNLFEWGFHWVLSRMSIHVRKLPAWGDVITVKTAGRGINKLFALREFLVEDSEGNPLATAMSAWLLLDSGSKRPKRPNHILPAELFPPQAESELLPEKIPLPSTSHKGQGFLVRPSDLDMNNHVNNVSYIRWVEDFCTSCDVPFSDLEINYLAEAILNETINIFMANEEDSRIILTGSIDGKPVFIARITPK
ncbi:MAG TPA: acyl-ACP thioesterase domain-containing protein [Lunatimonas sp.]|nr:acyl-ACP thioesterase domain-containing protein [Lunatimonas sp.]